METGATSPRRHVAEQMGVSTTTVDRLLAQARKEGFLERYDGGQGKHGKS
jgi:transposase